MAEIAKENPLQAQSLLQQDPRFTLALLEAEYYQGMLTTAAPGMDILLEAKNRYQVAYQYLLKQTICLNYCTKFIVVDYM